MTTPRRIQRRRTRGWRAPVGAKYVGRGTRWGNPWVIARTNTLSGWAVNWASSEPPPQGLKDHIPASSQRDAHALAVELYEMWLHGKPTLLGDISALARRDLMCWCPEAMPCHADVLLALANTPAV